MSNLYENLLKLCTEKNISGYKMCKDTGIAISTMTDLKMGRKKGVNAQTAAKLAEYFGVSVSYLLGEELDNSNDKNHDSENFVLDKAYFSIAKDAQESGLDPRDIQLIIDTLKKNRNK